MKKHNIHIISLLTATLLLGSNLSYSQAHRPNSKYNLMAEFKLEAGFLLSHHLELDVFQSHFPSFEFSIQRATNGKKRWEAEYGYQLIGISLWYSGLGGFEELGSAIAAYPFINFPLTANDQQSLNFRLGLGVGYLSNRFHRIDNYKNFAIGSHLNVAASLYVEYRRKINQRLSFSAGFGLTHFSNGSLKTPNYGLNILAATVGLSGYLSRPNPSLDKKILPELYPFEFDGRQSIGIDFTFSLGSKDMSEQYGEKYLIYAGYLNILKRVSYKSKIGIGGDFTYDGSDKYILADRGQEWSSEFQIMKIGVNVAYEMVMDRLSFMFNVGGYVSGKERSEGNFYQRLALRYLVYDEVFATLALSAHLGKAEYIGFGVGYKLDFIYKRKIKH